MAKKSRKRERSSPRSEQALEQVSKHWRKAAKRATKEARRRARKANATVRDLERRVAELTREQQALRAEVDDVRERLGAPPAVESGPHTAPQAPPGPPWWARRGPGGGRGAKGLGPVLSVEVPLESDDPAAPLWATVAARLPDEITTVDDEGRVVRYRYSAAGSTPQAPRYRRLADPPEPPAAPPRRS